jgi:hypothetical protein
LDAVFYPDCQWCFASGILNEMKSLYASLFLSLFLFGCSTPQPVPQRNPTEASAPSLKSRDEIMGVNRAKASVKPRAGRAYRLRNVASAFPDNGKNMLIKDLMISKASVKGARDHAPFRERIYGDSEHVKSDKDRFSILNKNYYSTPLSQSEANARLRLVKATTDQEALYQSGNIGIDDAMEPNNSFEKAYDLSDAEDLWMGRISEGVQWNEDWFKIWVSPQYRQLTLDLRFQSYLGDIDMKLFDAKKRPVAVAQANVDDEFLNINLDQGGYYWVQIYGSNRGNHYDFKFQTKFTGGGDDEYEDNDTLRKAYPLTKYENQWLSKIQGEAVAADNDFYSIQVSPGKLRVVADLRVDVEKSLVEQGDVDIRLLNSAGQVIASSANILDDDYIDFTVPAPGRYYLKVYPFNTGSKFNMYDLKWSTYKTGEPIASQKRAQKILATSQK